MSLLLKLEGMYRRQEDLDELYFDMLGELQDLDDMIELYECLLSNDIELSCE